MSRSHYNESLSHNSKFSIKHKTFSFSNETAAKKDIKKVYTLHCYCVNLHFNEEN